MKRNLLIATIVACYVAGIIATVNIVSAPVRQRLEYKYVMFEKTLSGNLPMQRRLNIEGDDGWNMAGCYDQEGTNGAVIILKREIK